MNEEQDEDLMQRYCHRGDMQAFTVLYERHKGPVFRYILRNVGQHAVAEELMQDVWASIIKSAAKYKPSATFKTYLYSITHNRIADFFRRSKLRLVGNEEDVIDELSNKDEDNPEHQLDREKQVKTVREALKVLPTEQRDVFVLKEESGLSLQDVAQVTGVSFETAKSRYRYALKKLASVLEGVSNDSE